MNQLSDGIVERGLKIFDAISDEKMENCIHCNSRWYSIHFRDGVCHGCQLKSLPGRNAMLERAYYTKGLAILLTFGLVGMFFPKVAAVLFMLFITFVLIA
ncbi:MAG: hypothetical protein HY226_03700 [Candidatus Vogelbacteria bacterium]|nr:hypothetical protein [Candidatus Vogelbacteria bacterium]